MLGEDDQRGARLVETGVHPAGDLHPAREREANVHPVAHLVGVESPADLFDEFVVRRDDGEGEREGG